MFSHRRMLLFAAGIAVAFSVAGCGGKELKPGMAAQSLPTDITSFNSSGIPLSNIPDFSGVPYVTINNGKPFFSRKDIAKVKEKPDMNLFRISPLDSRERPGAATVLLSASKFPQADYGVVGDYNPTGWHLVKYSNIEGNNSLYVKTLLISSSLITPPENSDKMLITATHYMSTTGMVPFVDTVRKYLKKNPKAHVLYRVTPLFNTTDLLAKGVLMEAYSVEDDGAGLDFCVFVYNAQPDINIDYSTGDSKPANDDIRTLSNIPTYEPQYDKKGNLVKDVPTDPLIIEQDKAFKQHQGQKKN